MNGLIVIAFSLVNLHLNSTAKAETPYQLDWVSQIGTYHIDSSYSVAVDAVGNTYLSGTTYASLDGPHLGSGDALLVKFDSLGNEVWSRQIGTSKFERSFSVVADHLGHVYISGFTYGSLVASDNSGSPDAFLTKFDSAGIELWSRQIGTFTWDESNAITVDSVGNIYMSGTTRGSLAGPFYGEWDAFLVKYNPSGEQLWSQQIGTSEGDEGYSLAVDNNGDIYLAGNTDGSLFATNQGDSDVFLSKFNSLGDQLWSQQIGSSEYDESWSIAVDVNGNAYITGRTDGQMGEKNEGSSDIFLSKFDADGNEVWSKQFGSPERDVGFSVAVNLDGYVYITGETNGLLGDTHQGNSDVFLAKFDPFGNEIWMQQLGTSKFDRSWSVVLDSFGNPYISGNTYGAFGASHYGSADAFIAKFSSPFIPVPSAVAGCLLGLSLVVIRRRHL